METGRHRKKTGKNTKPCLSVPPCLRGSKLLRLNHGDMQTLENTDKTQNRVSPCLPVSVVQNSED